MLYVFYLALLSIARAEEWSQLKILQPVSSDAWMQGAHVWVNWEISAMGSKGPEKIDIDLYQGRNDADGTLVENISFGVPIEVLGAEWSVPEYLPPGKDYFVRISSEHSKDFRVNGAKFAVAYNSTKSQGSDASLSAAPSQVTLLLIILGVTLFVSTLL
jgi:hypothetical protein